MLFKTKQIIISAGPWSPQRYEQLWNVRLVLKPMLLGGVMAATKASPSLLALAFSSDVAFGYVSAALMTLRRICAMIGNTLRVLILATRCTFVSNTLCRICRPWHALGQLQHRRRTGI